MKKDNVLSILKRISVIFIMVGIMFLSMGFYKKMAYSNPDKAYTTSDDYINSYVGGDAFNYIINGTYFMAYSVIGMGSWIISAITGTAYFKLSCENEMNELTKEKLPEI